MNTKAIRQLADVTLDKYRSSIPRKAFEEFVKDIITGENRATAFRYEASPICRASFPSTLDEDGARCTVEVTVYRLNAVAVTAFLLDGPETLLRHIGLDERLQTEGVQPVKAAGQIAKLMQNGPTLMIAHNAQFDACFLRGLLRGQKVGRIDWLDSLTVYKDRRAYPHKLANAIIAYDLTGKVQNSHRAIDDVLALFEVLKAMDDEREDLGSYVNLFGYNPKYGVSGRRIVGVRYEPQSFSKGLTRPEQTLPARVARR